MKRLLLVVEDQLVSNFYRGRLEAMGVTVDAARTPDMARRLIRDRNPDLTLVDPIMAGVSPIQTVESLREVLGERELWVISGLPNAVARAMEKAKPNRIQGRPPLDGNLFQAAAEALGVSGYDPHQPDEDHGIWVHTAVDAAPEAINALRSTLHDFVKDPRNGVALYDLFHRSHELSHRISVIGLQAIGRLSGALESLIYDLYATPEQINPSIVRTVSQAIDFLAVLFDERTLLHLKDPAAAEVFVVDDEPPARQMISAAMKLAALKITCADNAEMALSVLADNQFDLIFLDVNMPGCNGFELCTQVRQLEDHRKTPIVFITGMNTFQNRAQGSLSGGNDFIGKPFNLLELGVKALIWIFKGQLANDHD